MFTLEQLPLANIYVIYNLKILVIGNEISVYPTRKVLYFVGVFKAQRYFL